MNEEYQEIIQRASSQKKDARKLLNELQRRKKPRDIDGLFHDAHQKVFEEVDCLDCANCCKTTSPIFRDVDINRIAPHLGMKPSEFTEKYLILDREGHYVLISSPCPFLLEDNECSIYENRPGACREYPHTDRKNMHQIFSITRKNTLICPAVSLILNEIKKHV